MAVVGLLLSGCAAAQTDSGKENPLGWLQGEQKPAAPETVAQNGPSYTVEIRREGYTTQTVRVPHQGETHLQDALEKSGATKKIKRMELYILRPAPQGGPRQRLTAIYDAGERRVAWESDYAVFPDDHVVVIEDASTEFDHLVDRLLGPLGRN
jgi:hypothetical protein